MKMKNFMKNLGTYLILIAILLSVMGISDIGGVEAREPTVSNNITYPPTITTDFDKLKAVYSLLEQMVKQYNTEYARLKGKISKDKWHQYVLAYHQHRKALVVEKLSLKKAIRDSCYNKAQWAALGYEEKLEAQVQMYGERESLKHQPTLASAPKVDAFKALKADELSPLEIADPYEDFGTYEELDANGDITVTTTKIDVDTIRRDAVSHVRKAHTITGDFEHWFYYNGTAYSGGAAIMGVWAIADDYDTMGELYANDNGVSLYYQMSTGEGVPSIYLYDYTDDTVEEEYNAPARYCIAIRSSGAIALSLYTDDYEGTLDDTLDVVNGTEYAYIFGMISRGTGGTYAASTMTAYVENLDLHEAAPPTPNISNTPDHLEFGVLLAGSTYYANGSAPSNPVEDGDCYFTITNNSTIVTANITIAGNGGWTLTSGSPGADEIRITVYYSGQNPASGVVLSDSEQDFYVLSANDTIKWDFKLETGAFSSSANVSGNIIFYAYEG